MRLSPIELRAAAAISIPPSAPPATAAALFEQALETGDEGSRFGARLAISLWLDANPACRTVVEAIRADMAQIACRVSVERGRAAVADLVASGYGECAARTWGSCVLRSKAGEEPAGQSRSLAARPAGGPASLPGDQPGASGAARETRQ